MTVYRYIPRLENEEKLFKDLNNAIEFAKKDTIDYYLLRQGKDIFFNGTDERISATASGKSIYLFFNLKKTNTFFVCSYIKVFETMD